MRWSWKYWVLFSKHTFSPSNQTWCLNNAVAVCVCVCLPSVLFPLICHAFLISAIIVCVVFVQEFANKQTDAIKHTRLQIINEEAKSRLENQQGHTEEGRGLGLLEVNLDGFRLRESGSFCFYKHTSPASFKWNILILHPVIILSWCYISLYLHTQKKKCFFCFFSASTLCWK